MTRIDFYIINQPTADIFVCRLSETIYKSEKISKSGLAIYINATDNQHCKRLDNCLWTFKDQSFIPHAISSNQQHSETVLIGHSQTPQQDCQVLINLAEQVPDYFSRCSRVAEIITNSDAAKQLGRQRYNYYRERGYPIETHQLK